MLKHESIIKQMTLEEKCYLFSGKDFWQTRSVERLGIPNMSLSDGPHGIRKQEGAGDQLGLNGSLPATCFPTAATIANSWDPALGEEIGTYLGEEAASQGVGVLLGPGLNIKRSPLCGRNFEYFSEDPYLAGKMAAGYIRGIQKCSDEEIEQVVRTAIDNGINFFDLCGGGKNVYIPFGKAIAGQREKVHFQLHFGAVYNDKGEYGWSRKLKQIKETFQWELEALGTGYVDFGFLHCVDEDNDFDDLIST